MAESLRRTVEAVLFAAARKLSLEELAKLCKSTEAEINAILLDWKKELEGSDSPTMLVQEGDTWKLTVREKFIPVVRKVVTQTEVSKSILETLAVVAYKAPVIQSKVIKIRTNKAYDHLSQLEKSGFITREKYGRSKMIKLTQKFFEYFDLDPAQLKGKFKNVDQIEKAIEEKEKEIEDIEEQQRKQTQENLEAADITVNNTPLETYGVIEKTDLEPTGVEVYNDKVGDLDVYEAEPSEQKEKTEEKPAEKKKAEEQPEPQEPEPKEESVEAPAETKEEPQAEETPEEEKAEEKPEKKVEEKKEPEEKKTEEKQEQPEKQPEPEAKHEPLTAQHVHEEAQKHASTLKPKEFKGKGLFPKGVPEEVEKKIEERIHSIMTGEEEKEEE